MSDRFGMPIVDCRTVEERLREQVAAQAAVIYRLREALEYYANQCNYCNCDGCEQLRYEFGSETQHAIFALAIPTDSTQILDEVRKKEREKCAKVCEEIYTNGDGAEGWLGIAANRIRAMEDE